MQQTAPPHGDMAALLRENAELRKENTELKQHIKQLQAFVNWENKLFATSSDVLSDAHKVIARQLPTVVKKAKERAAPDDIREDGLVRVYREDIAKLTGKSPDRVGANLQQMGEQGHIKRDFKRGSKRVEDKKTGEKFKINDNAVFLDVTPELLQANLEAAAPRNKGNNQKHFVCKDCGTPLVQVKHLVQGVCPKCGVVHTYDPRKTEDRAFIVDSETAENFDELYGDVDVSEVEDGVLTDEIVEKMVAPLLPPIELVDVPAWQARMQANAKKLEEANRVPSAEETKRMLRRPWACHCGVRSRWIEENGISHCTHCEVGYEHTT